MQRFALSRVVQALFSDLPALAVKLPRIFPELVVLASFGFVILGCQSGAPTSPPPPTQEVVIAAQPLSQTVPIGRTATFSVTATGTAPLRYQWSKNGVTIPGATSASYSTGAIVLGDSASTYQVTVSNGSSSATSNAVTLTAGARSPAVGDVRYLLWQQGPNQNQGNDGGEPVNIGITEESVTNAVGTPLQLGSRYISTGGCEWHASVLFLPQGMTGFDMSYQLDHTNYTPYASYLESVAAPNVVINSIDLEPTCDAMAVSSVHTTQSGGFDYKMESVPPSQLQATVAADGATSRIVTAVTFDDASGDAVVISYGWQGDTTTVYEAQTVIATPANVAAAATTLAGEGYFISAFGGNDTDGYMLIGMRVQGDTLPRPIQNEGGLASPISETVPFTVVVWFSETSGAEIFEQ